MWSLLSTPLSPREADVCSMLPLDRLGEALVEATGVQGRIATLTPGGRSQKSQSIQVPVHVALSALAVLSRVYFHCVSSVKHACHSKNFPKSALMRLDGS